MINVDTLWLMLDASTLIIIALGILYIIRSD